MDQKIKKAERSAIYSSCYGVTGEYPLTDSAIIILFAGMIGAGNLLSLLTTAILPFCNGLLILPFACCAGKIGGRKLMYLCCMTATAGFLLSASAPFFERFSIGVLFFGLLLFSLSIPGFIAGWFPLLDTFITKERRTEFLGKMRFFHQLSAVSFLFLVSLIIGKNPSIGILQGTLFLGSIIFTGRFLFLVRIPELKTETAPSIPWQKGIPTAIKNIDLTFFSLYQFFLNLGVFGVLPLAILYLKNDLKEGDNTIIAVSAAALAGMLLGYLTAAPLSRRLNLNSAFRLLHLLAAGTCLGLFLIKGNSFPELFFLIFLLGILNFTIASASVISSAKMMTLATPGNKTIAMAYCGMFYYLGGGLSRLLIPLLLECKINFFDAGSFRTLFLLIGIAVLFLYPLFSFRKEANSRE